jgi:hypothetical protein
MLEGKRYVVNAFGWQGSRFAGMIDDKDPPTAITTRLEHASGEWEGCYYPAGVNDVVAALTQQTGEYLERVQDIKERDLRVNVAQLERVFDEWRKDDVDIKIYKVQVTENEEARFNNQFEQFFIQVKNLMMVQANATLGEIGRAHV